MRWAEEAKLEQGLENYQAPEIVSVGSVVEATEGMGGSSKDHCGWTIPVPPPEVPDSEP